MGTGGFDNSVTNPKLTCPGHQECEPSRGNPDPSYDPGRKDLWQNAVALGTALIWSLIAGFIVRGEIGRAHGDTTALTPPVQDSAVNPSAPLREEQNLPSSCLWSFGSGGVGVGTLQLAPIAGNTFPTDIRT